MPTQLYTNDAISFVCGRNFTFGGADYRVGEDFDQELHPGRLDQLVRTRHIIPVIDSWSDKPRHWHRHVQLRENVLKKLGSENYKKHPETKYHLDEETREKGAPGEVTDVGDGAEYADRFASAEPGVASPWEETEDNGKALREAQERNIADQREADVVTAGTPGSGQQKATFVDGKEESEPVQLLNLGDEDHEVEERIVDEPENVRNEEVQALVEGEADPADRATTDPNEGFGASSSFNPSDHSLAEVKEYLRDADEDEKQRVIEAERADKGRKGIVGE